MIKALALTLCFFLTAPALAQTAIPDMPDPIRNLADDGAQIRYMGRDHGFDSWLSVKNGQEQYFYVPPGGTGFVMGVLFDNKGRAVTIDQIKRLEGEGSDLLSSLKTMQNEDFTAAQTHDKSFQSASERLFADTQQANWVPLGKAGAPAVYAVIDPQCGHCHALIRDLQDKGHLANGDIQLRLIPVGMSHESKAQAAFLIAAPDPQTRFLKHLQGDKTALPVRDDINLRGVERNLSYMQGWKFDATPMLVYRDKTGNVKIVRGRPKDLTAMLAELPTSR